MDKGTIEARLDALQAEAALKTNAREAAAHMIAGFGKLSHDITAEFVNEQTYDAGAAVEMHVAFAEALDARGHMFAEAIVRDTVADDVAAGEGPSNAPTRQPMPVSTTARPLDEPRDAAFDVADKDGTLSG